MNNKAPNPWLRRIICLAGGLLLAIGLTRLLGLATNLQVLSQPDALVGLPLRYTTLVVALIELTVALTCLFGNRQALQGGLLAWLLLNYIVFYFMANHDHTSLQCTCLGHYADPLGLSSTLMIRLDQAAVLSLLLGTLTLFIRQKETPVPISEPVENLKTTAPKAPSPHPKPPVPAQTKIACPHCGGHIQFDASWLGRSISCPHCKMNIVLKDPV